MAYETLVEAIYAAGALPELWPDLLEEIAGHFDARGGMIIWTNPDRQERISSPGIAAVAQDFFEQGWGERNSRISRYLARPPYAGFLTDLDLHSEEELRTLPIYRDFLVPRGADAGAATLVQGVGDDSFAITVEGFAGHDEARAALTALDALRPHLARAATLSGRLQLEQSRAAVAALDLVGTAAAMIDLAGRVLIANARFQDAIGKLFLDQRQRLRLTDAASDRLLSTAIDRLLHERQGSSIPIRSAGEAPAVLHIVPVRGDARDLFARSAGFVLLADPADRSLPDADLLRALFDLTPAEARVARSIAEGPGVKGVARESGLSVETVRSHLKAVFQKTGTRRQSELSALLARYRGGIARD